MAAKKSAKKSTPKYNANVKTAARVTGLSEADVKRIDRQAAEKNKRPLSFLATMLVKAEKHVPELRKEVARLAAKK